MASSLLLAQGFYLRGDANMVRTCPRVSTFAWRISRAASRLGKWVRTQPGILARTKLGAVNSGLGRDTRASIQREIRRDPHKPHEDPDVPPGTGERGDRSNRPDPLAAPGRGILRARLVRSGSDEGLMKSQFLIWSQRSIVDGRHSVWGA